MKIAQLYTPIVEKVVFDHFAFFVILDTGINAVF
jgi:hypothetical protein